MFEHKVLGTQDDLEKDCKKYLKAAYLHQEQVNVSVFDSCFQLPCVRYNFLNVYRVSLALSALLIFNYSLLYTSKISESEACTCLYFFNFIYMFNPSVFSIRI